MVISAQAFIKVQGWRMKASGMPDSSTSPSKEGLSCRWKEAAETRGFDLQIHPSEWKVEHFVQLALHEVPEHGAVQSKTEARLSVLKVLLQDPEPPGRAACCCFHHRPMAAPKTCSLVRGTAPPATRYRRHTWQGGWGCCFVLRPLRSPLKVKEMNCGDPPSLHKQFSSFSKGSSTCKHLAVGKSGRDRQTHWPQGISSPWEPPLPQKFPVCGTF